MKPLLLIKTGGAISETAAQLGDFEDWFAAALVAPNGSAPEIHQVDVFTGQQPAAPGHYCAALVTGSAAMVSQREPWSEATAAWLASAVAEDLPILGVCYGHQLLAHALGGEVGANPAGLQMGTSVVQLESAASSDALFCRLPRVLHAQTSHLESILSLPSGAVRLARTAGDRNHAVRFNTRTWGVQFHPEFSAEVMLAYIGARGDLICRQGMEPESLKNEVRETPLAHGLIRRFFNLAVGGSQ